MSALIRFVIGLLCLVGIVVALGAVAINRGALKLSMQELEQRYATADSKFVDVDGVRVHYMDQCSGPVVVLLHASLMNLFTWDSLAEALCDKYRVIRMDRLLAGLTGPDPDERYSVEGEMALLDGLLKKLNVEQFNLIATSSAGTVGFRYAAENPERVTSFILVNSAGLPRTAATNPNRARGTAFSRWLQKYHRSRKYWQQALEKSFISPNQPPKWLVDIVYDTNRRDILEQEAKIYMGNYRTGDPETVLGKIRGPVMVLWGMENATVMHLEADVFAHWLTNAQVTKKKYPDVGHYLYLEIPDQFEADVLGFLDQHAQGPGSLPSAAEGTVKTIIRGKSVCRNTLKNDEVCAVDRWSMYVHRDGSRFLHVVSDNLASNRARHVVATMDADSKVTEAYVSASADSQFVGSSYVVLRDGKVFVAADNSTFSPQSAEVRLQTLEQPGLGTSIGTGPASADGIHFSDFGPAVDSQDKSIYWVGGNFGDMFGKVFPSSNQKIGQEAFEMADGTEVMSTHYRMATGSEIWLLEPYDVLLRIRLEFGAVKGQVYETTELEIFEQSF